MASSCRNCGCSTFTSNMYRPSLCSHCFHTIADHFPEWREAVDDHNKRYFLNTATGQKLAAESQLVPAQVSGGGRYVGEDLPAAGVVAPHAAFWNTWVAALAPTTTRRTHTTAPAGVGASEVGYISDDDEDDDEYVRQQHGGAETGGGAGAEPAMIAAPPTTAVLALEDHPDAPSAVPATALEAIDLAALSSAMAMAPGSAPGSASGLQRGEQVSLAAELNAIDLSAAGSKHMFASPLLDVGTGYEPPSLAPHPPVSAPLQPKPPSRRQQVALALGPAGGASSESGGSGSWSVDSENSALAPPLPLAPPAAAPKAPSAAYEPPKVPVYEVSAPLPLPPSSTALDLSVHLAPVFGDPLLVTLSDYDPALANGLSGATCSAGGVTVIPMRQPYEEDLAVARYLVLTPFTMMAVAAHPTRLGVGILKWERSLLSIRHLATQPLLQMETLGEKGSSSSSSSARRASFVPGRGGADKGPAAAAAAPLAGADGALRGSTTRSVFRRSLPQQQQQQSEPPPSQPYSPPSWGAVSERGGQKVAADVAASMPPLHTTTPPAARSGASSSAGTASSSSSGGGKGGILGFFTGKRNSARGGGSDSSSAAAAVSASLSPSVGSASSHSSSGVSVLTSPLLSAGFTDITSDVVASNHIASSPASGGGSGSAATSVVESPLSTMTNALFGSGGTAAAASRSRAASTSSANGGGRSRQGSDADATESAQRGSGSGGVGGASIIIGLLASFAPETSDSITFLRTYRAGRRPVTREGWLRKRKRTAWREHAPLGPLGWKKRWFVLELTRLLYYTAPPSAGGKLKGVVPLSGWVEVSRTGPDAGLSLPTGHDAATVSGVIADATTRTHSFLVRTGTTFHVFQAADDPEAGGWVTDIAINAQHLGASQDEPQCMLLPTAADANALADAIRQRRGFLVCSMSETARASLGDAVEVTMDIVTQLPPLHVLLAQQRMQQQGLADRAAAQRGGKKGTRRLPRLGLFRSAATASAAQQQQTSAPLEGFLPDGGLDVDARVGGMRVGDALDIAEASGGITDEFLRQLPPSLADVLLRYSLQLSQAEYGDNTEDVRRASGGIGGSSSSGGGDVIVVNSPLNTPRSDDSGDDRQPSVRAAANLQESWYYIDDSDRVQGPYPCSQMAEWLHAGYFGPTTLARFAGRVSDRGLDPSAGIDSRGAPSAFLPLATLYADPNAAFVSGDTSWVPAYTHSMGYQALVNDAAQFVTDPGVLSRAVVAMKEADMPPDLGILLDMCNVTALPSTA